MSKPWIIIREGQPMPTRYSTSGAAKAVADRDMPYTDPLLVKNVKTRGEWWRNGGRGRWTQKLNQRDEKGTA